MGTHNGKIGRLPRAIREQINQRLLDNEPAGSLLPWLNALPAVQALLAVKFGGKPINEPNLSHWRTGGYQQWAMQVERRTFVSKWIARQSSPMKSNEV